MKSSTSTFIEWGAIILVAFFAVPKLLGAFGGSNARTATQYSPGAAANAQAARAINTAGLVGNTALGDFLARLLKPPAQQNAGAKGGNTGAMSGSGGGATRPAGAPDMSWFGGAFNGGSVGGVSDPALGSIGSMPSVFNPDSITLPTYDELYGVYQANTSGDTSSTAADYIAGFGVDNYADMASVATVDSLSMNPEQYDPWSFDALNWDPSPAPVLPPLNNSTDGLSDFDLFGFGSSDPYADNGYGDYWGSYGGGEVRDLVNGFGY